MVAAAKDVLSDKKYFCHITATPREIRETQSLRYQVFAEEMGAEVTGSDQKLDTDDFDSFCRHLLVRDTESGKVVASTRMLSDERAREAGRFYSATEFDIEALTRLSGRKLEIGRTCVHPEYRRGAVIGTLWSGVARHVVQHNYQYLFGCASIPAQDGGHTASLIANKLVGQGKMTDENMRVTPKTPLTYTTLRHPQTEKVRMPPLLKAYLNIGAKAAGMPCLDEAFGVADILMLLSVRELTPRYARHFFGCGKQAA